jgi:hypothetical protein
MNAGSCLKPGLAVAMALAWAAPGQAMEGAAAEASAAPTLEPAALAALDSMGAALRALPQFSLTSETSLDVVLADGQKIERDGTLTYRVIKPDRLFVEIRSDRRHRELWFDGEELTINSPTLGMYASTPVEARTLAELAINSARKFGIEFPLADMFFWGTEHAPKDLIRTARHVGIATLDGQKTDHYAFTQEGVHWQVWIAQAGNLPKKIVITSFADPALPQYRANLHWDTTTPVAVSAVTFTPAPGAQRITLASAELVAATDAEPEN